jgi:dTDP-4-amino-4,6-dideoxygalactose transaminase
MIEFIDVSVHNKEIFSVLIPKIEEFINSGNYVLGRNLEIFEASFAKYCGTKYAVGVNSGTDALIMALRSLKAPSGGEVLTVSFTFPATIMAILNAGLIPQYVDVDMTGTMCPRDLEEKINSNTVAIMPVHFMGHTCDMTSIKALADAKGIPIIEDACQSAGGTHNGQKAGSFGYAGCFSFFPTKNLSCLGDGGMITTNEEGVYNYLLRLRNFGRCGREEFGSIGLNSRLDEFQAIVLNEKLKNLDQWLNMRRLRASYYDQSIESFVRLKAPVNSISTYHLYVVTAENNMDAVEGLKEMGIDCRTHYAVPCHKQPFSVEHFQGRTESLPNTEYLSRKVISLPLSEFITRESQDQVLVALKKFF